MELDGLSCSLNAGYWNLFVIMLSHFDFTLWWFNFVSYCCGSFLILCVCLHFFSVWWRQTLWTTVRTPWPGRSTPLAAPCVWCSDPLYHTHAHTLSLNHVKLSLVSIPLSGCLGWLDQMCSEWVLCIPVCQLCGCDEELTAWFKAFVCSSDI